LLASSAWSSPVPADEGDYGLVDDDVELIEPKVNNEELLNSSGEDPPDLLGAVGGLLEGLFGLVKGAVEHGQKIASDPVRKC